MKLNFKWTTKWTLGALAVFAALTLTYCIGPDTGDGRALLEATNPGLSLYCDHSTHKIVITSSTPSNSGLANRLSGEDCDPSDNDTATALGITGAFLSGTNASAGKERPAPAASSASGVSLQEDSPTLLALPFQPRFPTAALAGYTPTPACTPNTFVYSVNHFDSTIHKIATCPLALAKVIPVCSNPLQATLTPDGSTAVVTCFNNAIAFVDTATDKVSLLPTPLYNPNGVAISPDGTIGYFTSYTTSPSVIFAVNLTTRQLMPGTLSVNSYPKSLALTPDGSMLWVTFYQSSSLYVIDTLSMTVTGTINAGGEADTGIAITPDGTLAYVSVYGGSVAVFNTSTLARVASIPVGDQPTDIFILPNGTRAYVNSFSTNNPATSIIDIASNTVIGTLPQTGPAMGLVIFH